MKTTAWSIRTYVGLLAGSFGLAAATAWPVPLQAATSYQFSRSDSADAFVPSLLVMNEDQFKGKWKQFKGELKEKWAKFTDDDILYIEGSRDKLDGKIQERYGDRKEEVKKWIDEWFEQHKAGNSR